MQKIDVDGTQITVVWKSTDSRLVYGTRTNKWYAVGPDDRDYSAGLTFTEFRELGEPAARAKYLAPGLA